MQENCISSVIHLKLRKSTQVAIIKSTSTMLTKTLQNTFWQWFIIYCSSLHTGRHTLKQMSRYNIRPQCSYRPHHVQLISYSHPKMQHYIEWVTDLIIKWTKNTWTFPLYLPKHKIKSPVFIHQTSGEERGRKVAL